LTHPGTVLVYLRIIHNSSAVAEMGDRAKWAEKWRGTAVPLSVRELDPHLTQCRLGRGLPPTKWHLDPSNRLATIHERYSQRDRLVDGVV